MKPELTVRDLTRFWSLVDKQGPDDCWNWLGACVSGYGKFITGLGWCLDARYIAVGSTRYDLLAWHRCHNKRCCNPNHIQVGTREEKILDGFYVTVHNGPIPELTDADRDRFWSKVDIQDQDDCWPWLDFLSVKNKYGVFYISAVKFLAHRVAYSLALGNPRSKLVCHSCDNPSCCNPEHLWLGTSLDNILDMIAKGRKRSPHGSNAGMAKLTEIEVLQIRDRAARGQSLSDLAKLYPVTTSNIRAIVNRQTWAHI